tara:strand:- start:1183 stop:1374 length:192 start_codon:yes stop_codon:yes gene_type:complete
MATKNVPNDKAKWSRAKAKARSKFKVYPSAYANAYAVQQYKKMGGTWSTKSTKSTKRKRKARA